MVIKTGRFGRFISHRLPGVQDHQADRKDTGAVLRRGMIVERRSKKGRTFFGCANYTNCDFVSWDRVIAEPCPVCGSYVTAKARRGGEVLLACAADKEHDVSVLGTKREAAEQEPVEV